MYEACLWPVSNAGVILKLGHLSIGIDLFTETEIAPYREMPKELYLPLMGSTKSLDLLLITHTHKDHYQKSRPICLYIPSVNFTSLHFSFQLHSRLPMTKTRQIITQI